MKNFRNRTIFVALLSWVAAFFTDCTRYVDPPPPVYLCVDEYISICEQSRVYSNALNLSSSPVFAGREKIQVPPYQFLQNSTIHPSKGEDVIAQLDSISDCCTALELMDDLGGRPTFEWVAPNSILCAAAIFKNKVELMPDGNSIKNVEDIVWTWNSGMNTGSQNSGKLIAEFEDGRDVKDGKIQTTITPLESGYAYSWMVWAWNTEGTEIISSSNAMPFRVGIPNRQPLSFSSILGSWRLESAIKLPNGPNTTSYFKIRQLDIYKDIDDGISFDVKYIDSSHQVGRIIEEDDGCVMDLNNISFIKEIEDAYMFCDERIWLKIDTPDGLFEITLKRS